MSAICGVYIGTCWFLEALLDDAMLLLYEMDALMESRQWANISSTLLNRQV